MLAILTIILIIWLAVGWFYGAYVVHSEEWRYVVAKYFWLEARAKVRAEFKEWWNSHPGIDTVYKLKKFREMNDEALSSETLKQCLQNHSSIASGVAMIFFILLGPIGPFKYSKAEFFDEETLNKFRNPAAGK